MAAEAPTSAERRMKPGLVAAVDRLVARVDGAEPSQTAAGARVRKGIAVLVGCYALVYVAQGALHGSLAHLHMHIADVENGEAVEARGKIR